MEIIGLSGYARTGKDEAAKVLVEEFGFIQVAFADKLREVLYQLNPLVLMTETVNIGGEPVVVISEPPRQRFLQDIINEYGWGGYKETLYGPEIRRLLQRLGTEAGRETLWDTVWIDAAFANLPDDAKVVVSDARFFNEFDAIRERGGKIWRIERPGVGPTNDHPSETEAPKYQHFSYTIWNDGDLEMYRDAIRSLYQLGY